MFNSTVLDVAIGLVVVYFVLATTCSTITEAISRFLGWRAQTLWLTVQGLFQNTDAGRRFATDLYNHDLLDALSPAKAGSKPSYMPSHLFSLALVDRLGLNAAQPGVAQQPVNAMLQEAEVDAGVKGALKPLAIAAGTSIDQFRLNVESWFDAAMQRASGWYKRRTQTVIFWIALAIVIASNADTLMIANTLWSNPTAHAALADSGKALATGSTQPAAPASGSGTKPWNGQVGAPDLAAASTWSPQDLQKAKSQVDALLGWSGTIEQKSYLAPSNDIHDFPHSTGAWFYKLVGLLITAYAITLGAPFWFDILKRFVNIRGTGASPTDPLPKGAAPSAQTRIPSNPAEADA